METVGRFDSLFFSAPSCDRTSLVISFMSETVLFDEKDSFKFLKDVKIEEISRPRNLTKPAKNERTITISAHLTVFVKITLSKPYEIIIKTVTMQIKTKML